MTENELPEWLLSTVRDAQAYGEEAQQAAEAVRMMMPALQDAREYAEQARQVLEMARAVAPIAEYIRRHTEQTEQALAVAGLLLAHADEIVLGANLSLLRPSDRAVGRPRHQPFNDLAAVTDTLTVVKIIDSKVVDTQPDKRPETRRSIDLAALGVKLLIAWALIFPMVQAMLTPEEQEIFGCYIATIALALTVKWRYDDKHKD